MPVQIQSQRNKAAKPSITVREDMGGLGGGHLCAAWKDIHQFICPLSVSFTLFFDIDKRHRNRNSSSFRETRRDSGPVWCHCFAFFWMVPTAEMTVVLVPLAVVVTDTTEGRVAVVVMMVGWARVTGMAESHLLLRFWASVVAVVVVVLLVVEAAVLEGLVPFLVPVTNSILVRSFLAFSSLSISTFWALARDS